MLELTDHKMAPDPKATLSLFRDVSLVLGLRRQRLVMHSIVVKLVPTLTTYIFPMSIVVIRVSCQ